MKKKQPPPSSSDVRNRTMILDELATVTQRERKAAADVSTAAELTREAKRAYEAIKTRLEALRAELYHACIAEVLR